MILYLSIFVLLGLTLYLDYVYDIPKAKNVIFLTFVVFFILLGGLRWKTGTDWKTYYAFFYRSGRIDTLHYESTMEVGYRYLNYVIRHSLHTFTGFLVVCSILIIGIKSYYLKKYTSLLFLGLFLYYAYFFADIFFVRQSLAISITLLSTRYIIKRRFLPFFILVLLASSIHAAAIVFTIAYFVYPLRIPGWFFFISIGVSLVLMVFGIDIILFKTVLRLMGVNGILASKLEFYMQRGAGANFGSGVGKYVILFLGALKRVIIFPVFLWGRKWIDEDQKAEYNGMLNLCLLGACLYFLMGNFSALQRASTYFSFYEILAIIFLIKALRGKIHAVIPYGLAVLYAFVKFYYGFAAYHDLFVPYYSIFSKHIDRYLN